LKKWIRKIHELDNMRIALVGGDHSSIPTSSRSFAIVASSASPPV
jgi:hypothetical protein